MSASISQRDEIAHCDFPVFAEEIGVSPETRRQLTNDTEADEHVWLAIGVPALRGDQRLLDEE